MQRLLLVLLLTATTVLTAHARPVEDKSQGVPLPGGENSVLVSHGTSAGLAAREIAGPDTFVLYGGPGEPAEGKFQMPDGVTADWGGGNGLPGGYGGGPDAWTPVDFSFKRNHWHVDTFNAENLNWNGAGNHAMWCGLPASDPDAAGWVSAPGYGNSWFDELLYVSEPVADESAGQVVDLDFFFNYDAEESWDFVEVQFLRAGVWETVMAATGTNGVSGNFPAPGTPFNTLQFAPIEYFGNDYAYGGLVSGGIAVKILFWSDGAWSNEDGFWPGKGAAQVDDITITHSEGTFFEDFEGGGPYLWEPWQQPFFGDFADVYTKFTDIDPCRENRTPVVGFIDQGQVVRNGPGPSGMISTGGEINVGGFYGIPGNWAVNRSSGLSADVPGTMYIDNAVLSPEILLDLPGSDDDDPAFAAVTLRFDVFEHSADFWRIAYRFMLRSALPGQDWGQWLNPSQTALMGYAPQGRWQTRTIDLSNLIPAGAERIQVGFRVEDLCPNYFFCDPVTTPAPVFDNVTVTKHRLPGPVISAHTLDLAQGGFPVSGAVDASTPASRDLLDRPFDTGRDASSGEVYTPGDSVVVDVVPVIPGSTVTDVRMVWALSTNALFEDAIRSAPSRPVDEDVVAGPAGTVWSGAVVGQPCTTPAGAPIQDRYFVDLPDLDFAYPGDVLQYYIQATDSDGRVSTMPHDLAGFGDFSSASVWTADFTVRALPSLVDPAGAQPALLVIDDSRRADEPSGYRSALGQLGYLEGVDYDVYRALSPSIRENTIGSPGKHGATPQQLSGYAHVLYLQESSPLGLTSGEGWSIESNDIELLLQWWGLAGARNLAVFGESAAAHLNDSGVLGQALLADVLAVNFVADDVAPSIGGQITPGVVANPAWNPDLATPFVAYGGCPQIAGFDHIRPAVGASAGHHFTDPGGTAITDPSAGVASVVRSGGPGHAVTVPFALFSVQGAANRAVGPSARTALLGEVLALFGSSGGSPPVGAPAARAVSLRVAPNPFNPRTVVEFSGVLGRSGAVQVFNLRGELVRELHRGEFTRSAFLWDGTDDAGASVASGVYVVRAMAGDATRTAKVALVR